MFPSDRLRALAETEFPNPGFIRLVHLSLKGKEYERNTAFDLLSAARGLSFESWPERRFAVLLLENHLLRLTPSDLTEFDLILFGLGLKPEVGSEVPIRTSVLQEGFTSLSLKDFVPQFIRKLNRLDRVHQTISNSECDEFAWVYLLCAARQVSKLALARYVFTPEEVFHEIVRTLRVTKGARDTISHHGALRAADWEEESLNAPEFESEIAQRLCKSREIFWISESCGSELNSLVEYPLTSAVLVIKPPGSDLEIEIKRAGTRGPRALEVIRTRNGRDAPTSHRLFGGSLGWLAQRETAAAKIFSKIYRLVHEEESPCSVGIMNSSIVTVPVEEGEAHILDYLTDEKQFGPGFDETREAMRACVETFPRDTGVAPASYTGEAGLTLKFVGQALPQQAVIFGSSSFRLDRIAAYLSDDGPEEYFRTGLGRGYTLPEARWLADSVLEEMLGQIVIPSGEYENYAAYVRDAFSVPENRRRADETFLSVMLQIGKCWGTLLAVRGFSDGESFVLRNVGLKSVWRNAEWQVRIIFMDHDDLTVAGNRYQHLWPWREASGMSSDLVHILGGPMGDEMIPGEVGILRSIYRVSPDLGEAGVQALEEATRAAYSRTQSELGSNQELQKLFNPNFLQGRQDFDKLVPLYLRTDPSEMESWQTEAAAYLKIKNYDDELIAEYTKTVSHFRWFFERLSFVYGK